MAKKSKRYDDEFRASAVLMLEAAGYPDKTGALSLVAKKTGAPARTLSRWFKKEQNPPPDRIVNKKRGELVDDLENLAVQLVEAMGGAIEDATLREMATAFGIVVDKWQLLTGKPTGIQESRVQMTEQEKNERIRSIVTEYGERPPTKAGA